MYEIWKSIKGGMVPGPRFRNLCDARRFIDDSDTPRDLTLVFPDGGSGRLVVPTNRRKAPRRRLSRRATLSLPRGRHQVGAVVLDGSPYGLRVRLTCKGHGYPVGWIISVELTTSYQCFTIPMRIVWARESSRGLECIGGKSDELRKWLDDTSGANTPPYGVRVVERRQS
jgi:hypothetical protein